jgi:type VI secretion system protein ImpG
VLRNTLSLYDFQVGTPRSAAARIAAIRKVEARLVVRMLAGAPVRGSETTVELDEAAFLGPGEAHLLLGVLDGLFADSVGINSFNQVAARLHPSDTRFRWPPRNGNLPVI